MLRKRNSPFSSKTTQTRAICKRMLPVISSARTYIHSQILRKKLEVLCFKRISSHMCIFSRNYFFTGYCGLKNNVSLMGFSLEENNKWKGTANTVYVRPSNSFTKKIVDHRLWLVYRQKPSMFTPQKHANILN